MHYAMKMTILPHLFQHRLFPTLTPYHNQLYHPLAPEDHVAARFPVAPLPQVVHI